MIDGDDTETPADLEATEAVDEQPRRPSRRRSIRQRGVRRARVIPRKRLTRDELRAGALAYPPTDDQRPTTREQCRGEQRPCPWVACRHHLYLDINPDTGSIKINFPDLEPWELAATCSLDLAENGGMTLEDLGEVMNLTRERMRQVEVKGLMKLRANALARGIDDEALGAFAKPRDGNDALPDLGGGRQDFGGPADLPDEPEAA